jgi:hypothetical protein
LITFYPDNTYTFISTGGDLVVENAPYSIEGDILKLDHGNENVRMGFEGEYEWSPVAEGVTELKLVTEKCGGRAAPLRGAITPVR